MLTLGSANPLLSVVEDTLSIGLSAMAVLAPLAALVGVGLLVWVFGRAFRGAPRN